MPQTVVGIDVGTTKVCTLVGQIDDQGVLSIIGVGVVPANGVRKGVITDMTEATQAIAQSVARAERVSGYAITEAYLGVGGAHISSQNSRGVVAIGRGDRPVDREDIERAMEAAQAVTIPHNRRIIHSIPREFIMDGQDGVKNPLGLMGFRLEVEAHLVTGAATSIQNLVQCVESNQIHVLDLVLQPLASAEAVLTDEEKNMGVAVVDIGGGTIDMAIYVEGSVWETLVIPLGGYHVSNDIAMGLRTPFATAEEIKIRYAHAVPSLVDEGEVIEFASFGDESLSTISRRRVCEIAAERAEEMLDMISQEIRRSGFESLLPAGIVLTGGAANLRGLRHLAVRKLRLPVRVGMPRRLHGLAEAIASPAYATSEGLVVWGVRQQQAVVNSRNSRAMGGTWQERVARWLRVFLPGA